MRKLLALPALAAILSAFSANVASAAYCGAISYENAGVVSGDPCAPHSHTIMKTVRRVVYDQEVVQATRSEYQTVYEDREVQRTRYERSTEYREVNYTVTRPVYETREKVINYTVMKPVYETRTKQVQYTVRRPVYETHEKV
ncbi:MAG: hypothetical protein ACKN9U_04920, partial [Pirellulaceae bacterium]